MGDVMKKLACIVFVLSFFTFAVPITGAASTPVEVINLDIITDLKNNIQGSNNTNIKLLVENKDYISYETIKSINSTAKEKKKTVTLLLDQRNGINVISRISISSSGIKKAVNTKVYLSGSSVDEVKTAITKDNSNTVAVIVMGQTSPVGTTARISVGNPLPKVSASQMVLYFYNSATGETTWMKNSDIKVDSNGFISFTADPYGVFIISDQTLSSKGASIAANTKDDGPPQGLDPNAKPGDTKEYEGKTYRYDEILGWIEEPEKSSEPLNLEKTSTTSGDPFAAGKLEGIAYTPSGEIRKGTLHTGDIMFIYGARHLYVEGFGWTKIA